MISHKKLIIIAIMTAVYILSAFYIFTFGKRIDYATQKDLIDNIRDVTSIIFGVCGAWLALSYPKALLVSADASRLDGEERNIALEKSREEINVLLLFLRSMFISTFILLSTLIIPYAKIVASSIEAIAKHREILLGANLVFLFTLALVQAVIMAMTIRASVLSLQEIHSNISKADFLRNRN